MKNKELEKAMLTIKKHCESNEKCEDCEMLDQCTDCPYDWEIEEEE